MRTDHANVPGEWMIDEITLVTRNFDMPVAHCASRLYHQHLRACNMLVIFSFSATAWHTQNVLCHLLTAVLLLTSHSDRGSVDQTAPTSQILAVKKRSSSTVRAHMALRQQQHRRQHRLPESIFIHQHVFRGERRWVCTVGGLQVHVSDVIGVQKREPSRDVQRYSSPHPRTASPACAKKVGMKEGSSQDSDKSNVRPRASGRHLLFQSSAPSLSFFKALYRSPA